MAEDSTVPLLVLSKAVRKERFMPVDTLPSPPGSQAAVVAVPGAAPRGGTPGREARGARRCTAGSSAFSPDTSSC